MYQDIFKEVKVTDQINFRVTTIIKFALIQKKLSLNLAKNLFNSNFESQEAQQERSKKGRYGQFDKVGHTLYWDHGGKGFER